MQENLEMLNTDKEKIKNIIFEEINSFFFFKKKYTLNSTLAIDLGIYGEDFEDLICYISERLNFSEEDFYLLFNKKQFHNPCWVRFGLNIMFYPKKRLYKIYKDKNFLTVLNLIEIIEILQENKNSAKPQQ